ncbi:hypothetical protein KFL_008730020 [Klebsormidium nitens]|uniref:Uncharacterized protein n=1 Tax=Klebsormidium nitens TaxID=105231 RepID=A0A1Y1IM48_KLENI|nr:hypothetical protein KFL_008730020 [Klebsormidium nitens]|eukprot:GAQ91874.1 hypothetical protein KFL_008730020 [Klebsormidium nitens]
MSARGAPSYSPYSGIEERVMQEDGAGPASRSVLGADSRRQDGRLPEECRPAFLQVGTVSRAAGSAYAEFASTKVLVAVYGPRESRKAAAYSDTSRLTCDVKLAAFATKSRGKYGQGTAERELSDLLHKALVSAVRLDTFPKASVDVFALVLESGGADLAVVVTAASLALADAGIEMLDMVAATSLSLVGGHLLVDPAASEERAQDGNVLVALMPARNEVTQMHLAGAWPDTHAAQAIELCLDGCHKLDGEMRACLREHAATANGS